MTFRARHLLGIEQLHPLEITTLLDLADTYADHNTRGLAHREVLAGLTQINMFFENSTRTQASFELAGKRLGADVMNMGMQASSIKKGETLIDTALTLNAMRPDLLVVRHPQSGAVDLLAQKVNCAVLNAGDGRHEHPTQALLDALTIRRAKGRLHRLNIAICGDIAHSRVARSNIMLLGKMENRIRLIGPPTLMPAGITDFGVEVYDDMVKGLQDVDVVMMLRLQKERMDGGFIPSEREYFHRYGLDAAKLAHAKPDAIVMHPGPMNRGVEIDGTIADDINRSVIQKQVEMGVAVRMAAMDLLARNLRAARQDNSVMVQMMLDIPANDHGALYVLAYTGPAGDDVTVATIIGSVALNTDFTDLITPDQRAAVPLPDLIRQGYDLPLTPEQDAMLRHVQGTVLLVMSRAFGGQAQQITLPAGSTLVTILRETPTMTHAEKLTSASGAGELTGPPAKPRKSDARMSGMVATAALLIMFALVGLVVWVGG